MGFRFTAKGKNRMGEVQTFCESWVEKQPAFRLSPTVTARLRAPITCRGPS